MRVNVYVVERHGKTWLAHEQDHDCLAPDQEALHGEADTAVGALRRLHRAEEAGTPLPHG